MGTEWTPFPVNVDLLGVMNPRAVDQSSSSSSRSFLSEFCAQFLVQSRVHFSFSCCVTPFTKSRDFRTPLAYLVVSVMLPPFSSNISGHLAFNTALPIAITVFRVTAPPLTLRLCRIDLTSVVSSSLILDGLPWRGKAKKFPTSLFSNAFWYFTPSNL